MVDSILISILSCNPRASNSAWEIVGAQQRCFRWKNDSPCSVLLSPTSLEVPSRVSTMCSSPFVNHSPLVTSGCSESPALPSWRLQQLPPNVCAASACWLPSTGHSASSTFPPLPLLSSWEPKPSWEQGREMSSSPFLSHSRFKGSLPQTSLFLEPETTNVLISVFFSPGWLTMSSWRPPPGALIWGV